MSDVYGLGVSHGSIQTTCSAVSVFASVSLSVAVTSSVTSDCSKHSFYRPMKPSSEVNITYDETTKRYVQTMKKSTDRRRSLGFPGYQPNSDDSSCRQSLPVSVESKENGVISSSSEMDNVPHQRLFLGTDRVVLSSASPLFAGEESASDLSSMEIVTRCCLGVSESKTVDEHSQPSPDISQMGPAARPSKRKRASKLSGKVTKCSTGNSEPVLLSNGNSVTEVRVGEIESPESALPVKKGHRGNKKGITEVERNGNSKKTAAKPRAAVKKSEKVQRRTSPRKSDHVDGPSPSSVERSVMKEPRGRQKSDKAAKALMGKEREKTPRRRQKSAEVAQTPMDKESKKKPRSRRKADKAAKTQIDKEHEKGKTSTKHKTKCVTTRVEAPNSSSSLSATPVKRKRRSSSNSNLHRVNAETAASTGQLGENVVVRLPDFECFLTSQVESEEQTGDSCTSKNVNETTDGAVSTLLTTSHANCEDITSTSNTSPAIFSTLSGDCQMSSPVPVPQLSSVCSADTCVTVNYVAVIPCATVNNVSHQEPEHDSDRSGQNPQLSSVCSADTCVTVNSVTVIPCATVNNVSHQEPELDSDRSGQNHVDVCHSVPTYGQYLCSSIPGRLKLSRNLALVYKTLQLL